ncbi:hypothetical protein RvVAR031_35820 [Agrobacterium vitis]|uniref:VRR-NUC domain-containing protein n=1 Tax=Agrobacterium vitis TaxID=373 RepID=UPI0015DAB1B5|nr:VRR-NUC domain-containing protein [Agrobacterium vitis]BCH55972.1 hypothetical protein RvVAR031_35820 [Agrobacterium vitis]
MALAFKKQPAPLEHDEQKALFDWAAMSCGRYRGLERLFAVPNGGHRLKAIAGKMKAEGAKAGVPDTCLPVPRGGYLGLYIEMKRRGCGGRALGGRFQEQVDWQKFLVSQGYAVCTCYGWEEAAAAIKAYFSETLAMPDDGDCAFWGR